MIRPAIIFCNTNHGLGILRLRGWFAFANQPLRSGWQGDGWDGDWLTSLAGRANAPVPTWASWPPNLFRAIQATVCRFWYMSYFLSWSDASRTLKNQGVLRGNLGRWRTAHCSDQQRIL